MSLRVGFTTFSGGKVVLRSVRALRISPFIEYFTIMKTYYVYILQCADDTLYTGITSNLTKRLESHHAGTYKNSYTSKRRPVRLVFYCEFTDPNMAIDTEKQIKK